MKRLTIRNSDGTVSQPTSTTIADVFYRLAEYEDTGLEPKICAEYRKFEDNVVKSGTTLRHMLDLAAAEQEGRLALFGPEHKEIAQLLSKIACSGSNAANRLMDLIAADNEGRLVVLPCKVGDTIYASREYAVLVNKVNVIRIADSGIFFDVSFDCDGICYGCPHQCVIQDRASGEQTCVGECGIDDADISVEDFGKTVFLTREEAEAAMKGVRHAD